MTDTPAPQGLPRAQGGLEPALAAVVRGAFNLYENRYNARSSYDKMDERAHYISRITPIMPDSPIFARCDTLVLWVLQATVRYPRHYRAALGKATQEAALRLQRELVAAARRREKRPALQAADEALHELRLLLRQGQALGLLTPGQHEHVAKLLDEVGRLLGGWRKTVSGKSEE